LIDYLLSFLPSLPIGMATQMDAYRLLGRAAWMAPKIAYGDDQDDDDIGSASDSDSEATSSSSDLADDATSSSSSSSSSADDLFEMSALMTHLPIKYVPDPARADTHSSSLTREAELTLISCVLCRRGCPGRSR
jgi:hypothetical protein